MAEHRAVWCGQLIDGRHRHRACEELSLSVPSREYCGDEAGLVPFVVSLNLKRRHLNESQRAMVAAGLATMGQGARTDIAQICAMSQPKAAELFNVSERSFRSANARLR